MTLTGTPVRAARLLAGLLLLLALLAVPAVVGAQPAITISPESGPVGTQFVFEGSGFTPSTTLLIAVADANGNVLLTDTLQTNASGGFRYTFNSSSSSPVAHAVAVGNTAGEALAVEAFVVTAAGGGTGGGGAPSSPPRTGGGGMARQDGPSPLLLAGLGGLGVAALSGLAAGLAVRRRRNS